MILPVNGRGRHCGKCQGIPNMCALHPATQRNADVSEEEEEEEEEEDAAAQPKTEDGRDERRRRRWQIASSSSSEGSGEEVTASCDRVQAYLRWPDTI